MKRNTHIYVYDLKTIVLEIYPDQEQINLQGISSRVNIKQLKQMIKKVDVIQEPFYYQTHQQNDFKLLSKFKENVIVSFSQLFFEESVLISK